MEQQHAGLPPGPGWKGLLGVQLSYITLGPVEATRRLCERWGPIVGTRLATLRNFVVSEPDLIHEVFMDREGVYIKDFLLRDLDTFLGQGLLTADGDTWRRNRKLAAPALKRAQVEKYADWMVEITQREIETWRANDVVDIHHEMVTMTLKVLVKTMFDLDLEDQVDVIGRSIDDVMDSYVKRVHTPWRLVPKSIPTAPSRKFDRAVEQLDQVVFDLIARRRANAEPGDDLLHRLLEANDEEGGLSDRQLRDEVVTMFLAGHETTALALTYAWYLLSTHPVAMAQLRGEVADVLGDRAATAADVARLPYTRSVVQETLRMYSPAWIVGREAARDTTLGGYFVPAGTQVIMPQVVVHYDPRFYDAPTRFQPERWLDPDFEKSLPLGAYFPFGGGPRICIGKHFAMMEAILMLATIAQRWSIENAMDGPIKTIPAITLRPDGPVMMRIRERERPDDLV